MREKICFYYLEVLYIFLVISADIFQYSRMLVALYNNGTKHILMFILHNDLMHKLVQDEFLFTINKCHHDLCD